MSKFFYLRIVVLIIAFCGVVYVITHMSPEKVATGLEKAGLNPPPASPPLLQTPPLAHPSQPADSAPAPAAANLPGAATGAANETANGTLNLCRTRVHAIVWPDGRKIQEETGGMKAKWQAYNLDPVEIGSMDVEKWLSLHCEVPVAYRDALAPSPGGTRAEPKPYATFMYIDGTQQNLDSTEDGTYRFGEKTFTSPALTKALNDLISLANLQPQGP